VGQEIPRNSCSTCIVAEHMLDMQFNAAHLGGDCMTDEVQHAKGRLRVAYRFRPDPDQVEKLQGELAEKNIALKRDLCV